MSKERILSGMRPTGALHLGHYVGVIKNWLKLQNDHECFIFLADWHAFTSNFDDVELIKKSRLEYIRGWVASGLDPNKAIIYAQSDIPEVLMLNQIFLCMTPPGWADRSPSWKDFQSNPNADRKLDNLGFYTYPILQAADIAIIRGQLVPVGADQVSHLEIAREIIRKFNRFYKTDLPVPEALLTDVPKLPGTDGGSKMSSSIGNVISLQENEKSLQKKINKMKTDDQRQGADKPGNPDNCTVFDFHKIFSDSAMVSETNSGCRQGKLSCGECKQNLGQFMKAELMPIAEKVAKISDDDCQDILETGKKKVEKVVSQEWSTLKEKIGL